MASKKITSIHDLLEQYNERIVNQRDKGTSFERLMKSYLELDPLYQDQFKTVYLWSEWPHKTTGQDYGIDLVAEGLDGEFTAIQCKFYAATYQVQKKDIDSFFNESGKTFTVDGKKRSFARRIIISTSDNWSEPAEKSLHGQTIPVSRIHVRELEQSPIDWSKFSLDKPEKLSLKEKKKLKPHQQEAIDKVIAGFKEGDRGKLIMACGTGKTFTALKLAEKVTKKEGLVLFLVPSISLLSQTLREWTAESETPFHAFAVCSDSKVGKHSEDISKHDLSIPASTDTTSLIKGLERVKKDKKMTVIFSTYQSIDVVSQAQKKGLPEFDLIICDEAHRTTGVTLVDKEESHFVKVHEQKFIKGKKRIYMTATPRIFGDAAKTKADEAGAELCSMDDVSLYGPEFHRLGFGKAVSEHLLTDYKVLVLAIDESIIDPKFQKRFADENQEIQLEDIAKIIGCWNGLSKLFVGEEAEVEDRLPMKRAVAFARAIKDSKQIASVFQNVVQEYIKKNPQLDNVLNCELAHVDGTFNVLDRNAKLDWLKEEAPENTCRILTNARCLSEGVDVPALDAVLFLNPRDSMVDVVQSVGRIMRKAEGKKYGYVILPIGIPAGVPPDEALKDNKKYKVVWQVLQALRAHDDRFDAEINKIDLNKNKSSMIQVIGVGNGEGDEGGDGKKNNQPQQLAFNLPEIEEWKDAIYAKIVLKCGSRPYWENWAADVAKIAEKHTKQIQKLLKSEDPKPKKAFEKFLNGIRKNLNPSISETDAIEMLSQQLITKPVFDALFEHYKFTDMNPVSQSMQSVLKVFEAGTMKEDAATLKSFYDSVRMRVRGINNAEARQRVIKELYDRFFNVAFKKMSERLGIVYTPIEVVDFIIQSVEDVMQAEFGKSLSDEGVHILDPFTGTGTFIVRLLQSGIIKPQDLKRKFQSEIHANEIVLLAYYIASVNIEETYHELTGGEYKPFEGTVLTDTFQLNEAPMQGSFDAALPEIHRRVESQKSKKISAILSNPPYSAGQEHENDNNKNISYECLDGLIADSYIAKSKSRMGKSKAYDSYVRAIRWSLDRIAGEGVVGFVTGSGFLDKPTLDGMRADLADSCTKIYILNLRGDIRKNMLSKGSANEGQNIFESGSMTGIAITIFLRKPDDSDKKAEILYSDIGDGLKTIEKLGILTNVKSIKGIEGWIKIVPNPENDWIEKRSDSFGSYWSIGTKESSEKNAIFNTYSIGVLTNRDKWTYNFSNKLLANTTKGAIEFFNSEVDRLRGKTGDQIEELINRDKSKIKWTTDIIKKLARGRKFSFKNDDIVVSAYRPFSKVYLYSNADLNWSRHLIPKYLPASDVKNLLIYTSGVGSRSGFSALVVSDIPDKQFLDNGQCFPLYTYERPNDGCTGDLFGEDSSSKESEYIRRDAISDVALEKLKAVYSDNLITKEDIFYYVYGLLHSPMYRSKYQNDLKKMLPRIPFAKDFWGYSKKGRELADIHLNYESIEPFDLKEEIKEGAPKKAKELYRVNEAGMKFPKVKKQEDRATIIFNQFVTLKGIPESAYEYVVNGKPAIEWIVERYAITTDKDSGIKNDPNEWSDDPRYIVDLVKRIVRVSLETNRIVSELPKFELIEEKKS